MALATKNPPADSSRPSSFSRAPAGISVPGNNGPRIVRAVTIRKPAAELYAFWRQVKNLEKVSQHPVTITEITGDESHWKVTAPAGVVEWDSIVINDRPNALIAWRSREGAEVPNAGTVRFEPAPGDEGTELIVTLEYDPPGGKIGKLVAKLFGKDGAAQVDATLRRFKALMEAGEIPTIEGQPVGEPQASKKKGKK